jgi:hypothetical protein
MLTKTGISVNKKHKKLQPATNLEQAQLTNGACSLFLKPKVVRASFI